MLNDNDTYEASRIDQLIENASPSTRELSRKYVDFHITGRFTFN